jgi:acylphosphatase
MQWLRCIVSGRVQHVFYRKFVSQAMMRAGFQGYVRNLDDGTVEVVVWVTDEESELPRIHQILHEGSPMSEVSEIRCEEVEDVEVEGDGFVVKS